MSPALRTGRSLLGPYVLRHWRALAGAGASTVIVTAAELAQPWPLKLAIDRIVGAHDGAFALGHGDAVFLAVVAVLVLAIAAAGAAAAYLAALALSRAGERILHDLRVAAYAHLQRLSLAYHDARPTGDLVTRVTADVNAVGTLFSQSLGGIVSAALVLLGMGIVSFLLDPWLALAAFAVTPVLGVVTFRYRRRVKALARRERAGEGEIASLATEALAAMPVVKAFGSEEFERTRVEQLSEVRRTLGVDAARLEARFSAVVDVLGALAGILVVVFGVTRVAAGAITAGDLVVFTVYSTRTYKPLRELARQTTAIALALARAERVGEILAADDVLAERADAVAPARAAGEIVLEQVSFAYRPDRPALRELSLRIAAGSRVALVGASGAGKSTLGALLARFYDPDAGRVLLDGRDVRDLPLGFLRSQVGFLLQDTILFGGTVAENVGYASRATREELERAVRAAGAEEFVRALPAGYDTELGPRGIGLSGGQRQRLGIARVLLRNPSVLVLDEPTVGLDAATEAQLVDSLESLMGGRTTLLVTHSIPLARRCDRIVVVAEGRIVEDGSPEELLAREHGYFRRLAAHQELARQPRPRRAARPLPPPDRALPHLRTLLDLDAVAPVLEHSLGARVDRLVVGSVDYRPHCSVNVLYAAAAAGEAHELVVSLSAGRTPTPAPPNGRRAAPGYAPELGALVYRPRLDPALPLLAEPARGLAERLAQAGIAGTERLPAPRLLGYRPGRSASLRLGEHVLTAYADGDSFAAAARGLRWASALPYVRHEGELRRSRTTVQAAIPGAKLRRHEALTRAVEAGALLRGLHALPATGLVPRPPVCLLARALDAATVAVALEPELEPRVTHLIEALETLPPSDAAVVPNHGAFHAGRLRAVGDLLVVVGFDDACTGARAADLAAYAAGFVRGRPGDVADALHALDALVDGYGERPRDLGWHLTTAILRRARSPFRRFKEDWPGRTEAIVAAAETALLEVGS